MVTAPLYAAFVTRENALKYCSGVLTAPELWATAAVERQSGPVLFVNGLRGKMAWRTLARLCAALPPSGMVLASRIPSIRKRCEKFGNLQRVEFTPEGPLYYYFGEGLLLEAFLETLKP